MPAILDDRKQTREFILTVVRYMFRDDPGSSMLRQFEEIDLHSGPIRGVKEVVGDVLEWSQDISGDTLLELDEQLVSVGLPSLSLVRERW